MNISRGINLQEKETVFLNMRAHLKEPKPERVLSGSSTGHMSKVLLPGNQLTYLHSWVSWLGYLTLYLRTFQTRTLTAVKMGFLTSAPCEWFQPMQRYFFHSRKTIFKEHRIKSS